MTEPTEHHQHADLPQGDAPRPDLPQPDVSEPSGIAALISHRISRRTLGKLAIGPAVAASMASLAWPARRRRWPRPASSPARSFSR